METRMERYAKYREQIRRMPEDQFAKQQDHKAQADSEEPSPIEKVEELAGIDQPTSKPQGPYALYLKGRRRFLALKLVLFVLVLAAFIVWWFLMQGRKA